MKKKTHCVFGPVPSRRLGRSLGVDLVPYKVCTYDCIYCQLGKTTFKTIDRKEWLKVDYVLHEIEEKLKTNPDYITLSGSGEPTLYSKLDVLIDRIKQMTDIPVAVLTNGSLLWQKEVRQQLLNADRVIPSLDAGDEYLFTKINRPHEQITFEKLLCGLIEFKKEYKGKYSLEIMLIEGYNSINKEILKLKECVKYIYPGSVHLNTVTRPSTEYYAKRVSEKKLKDYAKLFIPPAEVIADHKKTYDHKEFDVDQDEIMNMLRRRPCSLDDIMNGLGMSRNHIIKYIDDLEKENKINHKLFDGKIYYTMA